MPTCWNNFEKLFKSIKKTYVNFTFEGRGKTPNKIKASYSGMCMLVGTTVSLGI